MKKIYQTPEMVISMVETENLFATSDPNVRIESSGSVDADKVEVKGQGQRQDYNVWNDDWSN